MNNCSNASTIDVSKAKLDMARLDGKGKLKTHVLNNDAKGIGFKHSKTCTNKKPSA